MSKHDFAEVFRIPRRNKSLVLDADLLPRLVLQQAHAHPAEHPEIDRRMVLPRPIPASWEQRKMDNVPGDMLIDVPCQKYGDRFNKEKDEPRLAAFVSAEEIPPEIKRIIEEIGG